MCCRLEFSLNHAAPVQRLGLAVQDKGRDCPPSTALKRTHSTHRYAYVTKVEESKDAEKMGDILLLAFSCRSRQTFLEGTFRSTLSDIVKLS